MRLSGFGLAFVLAFATPAGADAQQRVTAPQLVANAGSLLGHALRLDKLGCFVADDDQIKCTSYTGVYIVAHDIVPASVKAKIEAHCGDLLEFEDEPFCMFDGVFTPSSMEKGRGQVTAGDRSVDGDVVIFSAPSIALTARR